MALTGYISVRKLATWAALATDSLPKAYAPEEEEKDALLAAAKTARSLAIYPALMLAGNLGCGTPVC